MHFVEEYLQKFFDELQPLEFYRAIFPAGDLEEAGKQEQGKYNAIAVELLPKEENKRNIKQADKRIYLLNHFNGTGVLIECGF